MRMLLGSAVLLALGAAACGGNDENGNGTGSSDAPSTSNAPPDPEQPSTTTTAADPERPSTSTTPPMPEVPEPLPKPKAPVPLSVTPPPLKPQSGPTDRLKPVTVTGTLAEPVPGCLVVEADNGRWELVGTLPEGFGVGDRVEVTGRPAPEVEGGCGAPVIRVRDVRPG
ncbi:MAG: hypothetical protein ACRDZ0_00480 [Acidimicrobiales bacterium]